MAAQLSQEREPGEVLEGLGLVKEFGGGAGAVVAVDGVSLSLRRGELVAVVGESGSGKSTLGRLLMALVAPTAGEIRLGGRLVAPRTTRQRLEYWRSVQLVFQDPFGCLNPTRTIGQLLSRPYRNFFGKSRRGAEAEVIELLESVNLTPGHTFVHRYPHELSGGQRQRVVLARALAVGPSFVIADEPVSMLDVSVRAGILALMESVRAARHVGFLYITHDLASAYQVAERTIVMYGGRVVEEGPTEEVVTSPGHPYTQLLLAAVPGSERPSAGREARGNEHQDLAPSREGCIFADRCPLATEICWVENPPMVPITGQGGPHRAWCHALQGEQVPPAALSSVRRGPADQGD